ncbi:hypothetical protein Tco_1215364 [Tanacetum coccineum]
MSGAPVRYSPSANYLLLTENEPDVFLSQNISKKEGITKIVDVKASWAERKPRVQIEGNSVRTDSSTKTMVGDEREVEVLRTFNWPPSELITKDGFLPERGYSQFNDVSSGYLVVQPQVNPDSTIAQGRPIVVLSLRGGLLGANPIPHR